MTETNLGGSKNMKKTKTQVGILKKINGAKLRILGIICRIEKYALKG